MYTMMHFSAARWGISSLVQGRVGYTKMVGGLRSQGLSCVLDPLPLSRLSLVQLSQRLLASSFFSSSSSSSSSSPSPHAAHSFAPRQTGGDGLYRRSGGLGMPMMWITTMDRPTWQPLWEAENDVMPRDEFGVPCHIPPEVSTTISHCYQPPPHFFPFLKKLADDCPALEVYMHKLIQGKLTYEDYEEMFFKFAKPLKIYRKQIPVPFRTQAEKVNAEQVDWESAWLSYRQRVLAGKI
eukprot:GHVT01072715.1.p1 GENE.GHVT01072715.1~~GHVT01072715.1.p1  ORF type:complete len:238 (-),score=31.45 GHVT01072715.1:163-876(-)